MFRVFSVIIVSYPPITPGETDRLLRVAHDEVFRRQLALHAVERLQRLSRTRLPHNDLPAFEQVGIENVRRLADLPQNIIRGVNRVRDRPLIKQLQPMRDLLRRRLDMRIANHPRRESRTERRLLHSDRERRLPIREERPKGSVEERPFRAALPPSELAALAAEAA